MRTIGWWMASSNEPVGIEEAADIYHARATRLLR